MQQPPPRNASTIGVSVYSHSGEFAPVVTDLRLRGRGLDVEFIRTYRSSLAGRRGELGRGWSANVARRLERAGNDVVYHDGTGPAHRFVQASKSDYIAPTGFYGTLVEEKKGLVIRHRGALTFRFNAPERGGLLRVVEDRNGNTVTLSMQPEQWTIVDTLNRALVLVMGKGLIRELRDHASRVWTYAYDAEDRLVEVTQPATTDFPRGTVVRYAYDDSHRLLSITDAKGQTSLVNHYDASGRVVRQDHGSGAFRMAYKPGGKGPVETRPYRTTCQLKNGGTVVIDHNATGNATSHTLKVGRSSFAPEDLAGSTASEVPLVTASVYNLHSELTARTFPAGNKTSWIYADDDANPCNRGNLLRVTQVPRRGVPSDQSSLVTRYEYEETFQRPLRTIDPRGNATTHRYDRTGNRVATLHPPVTVQPVTGDRAKSGPIRRTAETTFTYNSGGQLLTATAIDGTVTTYDYYPASDPIGAKGPDTATSNPDEPCGYLARVTTDAMRARIRNEYGYDLFGNVTRVVDGKANATQLRYSASGTLTSLQGRGSPSAEVRYRYDANGNEIESVQSFARMVYDERAKTAELRSDTIREVKSYDTLNRLIARSLEGADVSITERFERDAEGRVVRAVQPLGNTTAYAYDEANRLIEKTFGVGTTDALTHRYAYTRNGAVRARTDGKGQTTTNEYDGFGRLTGAVDALGTRKTQSLDAAGNVVGMAVQGASGAPLLGKAACHVDEWNRVYRVDRAWHDAKGRPLGSSGWDGREGSVCTIVEYAEDGRAGRLWNETGNIVSLDRDGRGRVVGIRDLTGEQIRVDWDENDNPTAIVRRGEEAEAGRSTWTLRRQYDEADRLVVQQENDDAPRRFRYNALGSVIAHVGRSGLDVCQLHDGLGRRVGHAYAVRGEKGAAAAIVRRFEYDGNFRMSAHTDAAGSRTTYRYDALDRQNGVTYADGSTVRVEYDPNGNVVRVVDQNGTEVTNRFDSGDRLVARQSRGREAVTPLDERFEYDGAGRLVAATALKVTIRRTYDSLSRPMTEDQSGRVLRWTHHAGGHVTSLEYPGGEVVRRTCDARNRVTAVAAAAGPVVSDVRYRAADQIATMVLAGALQVQCAYDEFERLAAVEYRRVDDGRLIDGFRYQYDDAGRPVHEIQVRAGDAYGERYAFDTANRVVRVQYGVKDVLDPASAFESATSFEYGSEGLWSRRVEVDGRGTVLNDRAGSLDQRNRYRRFGDVSFVNDAAGNCVRKATGKSSVCVYTYDHDNRLIKAECVDARGRRTQTVEYFYDALGRQIRKVVTDGAGVSIEYVYVWAGTMLIEEYENGTLVRTYVYGLGTRPARLSVDKDGRTDYVYVHNGRGLASGVVTGKTPNAFAERYGYTVTGAGFMTEIDGVSVAFPSRNAARSGLLNSVLSDGALGSLRDWQSGTLAGFGGRHMPQDIAGMLNGLSAVTGKANRGVLGAMADQFAGYVSMLGLGGTGSPGVAVPGHASTSGAPDTPYGPDWSLYGMHDGKLDEDDDPPETPASDPGEWEPFPGGAGTSGPPADAPLNVSLTPSSSGPSGGGATDTNGPKPDEPRTDPSDNAGNDWIKNKVDENPKAAAAIGLIIQAIRLSVGGPPKMSDPDSSTSTAGTPPTREQIDAKLNGRKRPVNPNDGIGGGIQADASSPPRGHGGLDPTVALFDPNADPFTVSGETPPRIVIAPIDYVGGRAGGPTPPPVGGGSGGGGGNTARSWP